MTMITRKFSLLRHLLWAATLATGFGTVWFLLVAPLTTSIQEAWQGANRLRQESLVVRSDGTPLIRSMPLDNLSLMTYRDLNGREQETPEGTDLISAVYMAGEHATPGFFSLSPGWDQRLRFFMDEREPTVNWIFVHDGKPDGGGYFVGYERKSNRRVGFIGLNGFRTDFVPPDQWVPVRGALITDYSHWSSVPTWFNSARLQVPRINPSDLPPRLVYVPSGSRLRLVDLAARTITTVFESPEPIESPGIATLPSFVNDYRGKKQDILVRTRQQIHALDHKHRVTRVFTIPTEVGRASAVYWYEIDNGQAIAAFSPPRSTEDPDNVTKQMVYRITAEGAIQDRFELTLQTGSPATNQAALQFQVFLGLPAPAFLFVIEPLLMMSINRTESYSKTFVALLGTLWPSLLAVAVLASILAIITWRRARSFGLPKREQVTWAVFVLLFGFPAFVGFLLCRLWPIRQPCPTCHARAPRDRSACAVCGNRFPDPALKGIEIFA
jgi:hypothetical protein